MYKQIIAFAACTIFCLNLSALGSGIVSFGKWEIDNGGNGWADILWESNEALAGFQFDLTNVEVKTVKGGMVEQYNWVATNNSFRVLAYAPTPSNYIPQQPKPEKLIRVYFESNGGDISFDEVLFANQFAEPIKTSSSDVIVVDKPCLGDVNKDGNVNVSDVLAVVADWGQADSPADVNNDGIVNVSDLLTVMDGWGTC